MNASDGNQWERDDAATSAAYWQYVSRRSPNKCLIYVPKHVN